MLYYLLKNLNSLTRCILKAIRVSTCMKDLTIKAFNIYICIFYFQLYVFDFHQEYKIIYLCLNLHASKLIQKCNLFKMFVLYSYFQSFLLYKCVHLIDNHLDIKKKYYVKLQLLNTYVSVLSFKVDSTLYNNNILFIYIYRISYFKLYPIHCKHNQLSLW